jgi:superfamily II DNA or RNA helicase
VADEVGLGKTIQAGLVLAELIARNPALRALVIVPASLRAQWVQELRVRFDVATLAADRQGLDGARHSTWRDENPWRRAGTAVASLDFLKQPHVRDALAFVAWDLVIVDEAHDACGDSERHAACSSILRRARRVLLLTATPHNGDHARFQRLVSLGALLDVRDDLAVFRRTRADLGWPATRRVRWSSVRLSPPETRVLDALIQFERRVLGQANPARRNAALLLLSVFRKRALSTMAALDRSLGRRQEWLRSGDVQTGPDWSQPRLTFEEPDDLEDDDRAALSAAIGLSGGRERAWLDRLRSLTRAAMAHDSKVRRLTRLTARVTEPVVIFTEFRDSLAILADRLGRRRAISTLHGGQSSAERAHELHRFLDGATSILIATDVAGQGLNLQHRARWVISLELPWSPTRVEQRVGRVDRIGQQRPVHASLLIANHPAEAGVLAGLARRALSARRRFGGSLLDGLVPPDRLTLASMLLAGEPIAVPSSAPDPVPLVTTWARGGRALASLLTTKRRLVARWRGRIEPGRRPAMTTLRSGNAAMAPRTPCVAIFGAPIVTRAGDVLESHCLAVAIPHGPPSLLVHPEVRAWLAALAGARLLARVRRVRRLMAQASAHAAVDRAIVSSLRTLTPADLQPGLFHQRSGRTVPARAQRIADAAADLEASQRSHDSAEDVIVGSPTLAILIRLAR